MFVQRCSVLLCLMSLTTLLAREASAQFNPVKLVDNFQFSASVPFSRPTINNAGDTAFNVYDGMYVFQTSTSTLTRRIHNGVTTAPGFGLIEVGPFQVPVIGSSGQIAFFGSNATNNGIGILNGSNVSIVAALFGTAGLPPIGTSYSHLPNQVDINGSGIAFWNSSITDASGAIVRGGVGNTPTVIMRLGIQPPTYPVSFNHNYSGILFPTGNDAGLTAFVAQYSEAGNNRKGAFIGDGNAITTVAKYDDPAPSSGLFFRYFDDARPNINNIGNVLFHAGFGDDATPTEYGIFEYKAGINSLLVSGGQPAPDGGIFFAFGPNGSGYNDRGDMAFLASKQGEFTMDTLYFRSGATGIIQKVVGVGDPFDGSTLTAIDFDVNGLNNAGQMVFSYRLANGRTGIGFASVSAQEGSSEVLMGIGLLFAGLSNYRKRMSTREGKLEP